MCDLYTMCDVLYTGKNLLVTERTIKQRTAEQRFVTINERFRLNNKRRPSCTRTRTFESDVKPAVSNISCCVSGSILDCYWRVSIHQESWLAIGKYTGHTYIVSEGGWRPRDLFLKRVRLIWEWRRTVLSGRRCHIWNETGIQFVRLVNYCITESINFQC